MNCEECRTRFVDGFIRGQAAVRRQNKSGCCCVFDDNENIVSVCDAHRQWLEDALKDMEKVGHE
jgi:hypothetical protein